MTELRVPLDDLEHDPYDHHFDARYRGAPFTGVAIDEGPGSTSEIHYEDGYGHGRCTESSREGRLLCEYMLARGRYVGELREWFPTGLLRHYRRHEPPRLERRWNEKGLLIFEEDQAEGYRRRWYDNGVLREELRGDVLSVFTPSGNLAFVRERTVKVGEKPYAAHRFLDSVMLAELDVLASDPELEYHVFMYLHATFAHSRVAAVQLLRRLLVHPSLWVVNYALANVGTYRVAEVRDLVEPLLDDPRVPPPSALTENTARSATSTIGARARDALAHLPA
jgi:hypothetical protein